MAQRGSEITVSKEEARTFFLERQLLSGQKIPASKKGTLRIIEELGYVQIDTISVVERSHHLVLHSRSADYEKDHLHTLQATDKKIFEYWAENIR